MYSGIIHNSQNVKQPKWSPTNEWINKMWYIYTREHYLTMKMNEGQAQWCRPMIQVAWEAEAEVS